MARSAGASHPSPTHPHPGDQRAVRGDRGRGGLALPALQGRRAPGLPRVCLPLLARVHKLRRGGGGVMPSYIVKAAPDEDLYCEWSTIVDAPTWLGDREGLIESGFAQDRIERADQSGTSAFGGSYGWDDDRFLIREMVPRDGRT